MSVVLHQLTKSFHSKKPPLFSDLNLTLPKSKFITIVGPDGSGKTTLIRLIAGLLKPTGGSIEVEGLDTVSQVEEMRRLIGYMPQRFGLYEDLTVQQNLNLYYSLQEIPKADIPALQEHLLSFTGLSQFKDRLAGNLSGGMKQKLGLACALMKRPTLLLLDEPTVGVDPLSRRELWKMVEGLKNNQVTIVWSTVYLEEAEKSEWVVLLSDGKILFQGKPEDLTKTVENRVFIVKTQNKRETLNLVEASSDMVDATIQAEGIRVVAKAPEIAVDGLHFEPATPRIEDAFIDILGGKPQGHSPFSTLIPNVKPDGEGGVAADKLTKKFGNFTAADNVTFHVKKGEIFGLLGPNGAGKSTTYRMLCGLLKPTSGKALVDGLDFQEAPSVARSKIGYMAQKFSLYGNITVLQNLNFFANAYKVPKEEAKGRVQKLAEIFGLTKYLHTDADELPLGLKQRFSLLCAILHWPDILFLDEPTSGMDPVTRREFWSHVHALAEKGRTVMVTTHFMNEAENCDRLALLYQGKIIYLGSPEELKQKVISDTNQTPSIENAFIQMIENYDKTRQ